MRDAVSLLPAVFQTVGEEGLSLTDEFSFTALVHESNFAWFLCRHTPSGDTFILATAPDEQTTFQATQLLKNEWLLSDKLSPQWALKPVGSTHYHGRYALMYPLFSCRTLADFLRLTPQSLADFLTSAISLCHSLSKMHQQGIIHGDIKPANFILNEDGTYRLGGFGLASLSTETQIKTGLSASGGTLAYMSPEHTTRTSHSVSFLSDLYSLGMVLYELLTGTLPFGTADSGHAEWVHYHVASEPQPPHSIRPDVPAVLSAVILRLLAKSPEHRYQTAEGLLADLRRCHSTLTAEGNINTFTPGLQDTQRKGLASPMPFASHPQAEQIVAICDEVNKSGSPCLVVIGGAPGTGKSSMIATSIRRLQQKKMLLTVVKADQHSPVLPYALFTTAFRMVVLHLLGLSAGEVERWKSHITRLLGEYVGLAVHFLPELGVLLSQNAQLPDAHSQDARNQFSNMICRLVQAFTNPGRPFVMLIDDIHWADQASLHLLQNLLSFSEDIPLMLVVTHRDFASLPCPATGAQLDKLRRSATRVVEITPEPLSVKTLGRWLAEIFQVRTPVTEELSQLIHNKTAGNPLFTQAFFRQAVQDGLITHHHHQMKWTWDREALNACHYTENVADRVLQQMETIPVTTRRLLGKIACVGGSGELLLLSKVLHLPVEKIVTRLLPAVTTQLIALTTTGYAFTHDRIHEAAFSLLAAGEKDRLHLRVANRLSELAVVEGSNDALFRAVHHIASIKETQLIELDSATWRDLILRAARRAKNTGDSVSALRFLQTARGVTPCLAPHEDFVFLLEEAECEFLNGNLTTALALCKKLVSAPGELTDKAVAACLMAEIHMRQSHSQLALETAIAWLARFGIHLNRHPDKAECDAARIKLKAQVGKIPMPASDRCR